VAIDRPGGEPVERQGPVDTPPRIPADTPGAEGFPSRAESRAVAAAAVDRIKRRADTGDASDTASAPDVVGGGRDTLPEDRTYGTRVSERSESDVRESGDTDDTDHDPVDEGSVARHSSTKDAPAQTADDERMSVDTAAHPVVGDHRAPYGDDTSAGERPGPVNAPAEAGDERPDEFGPTPEQAGAKPPEELSPEERRQLDQHRADLAANDPQRYSDYKKDPDHLRKDGSYDIDDNARAEAKTGLDLRDSGGLPADLQRPPGRGQGDFYSPSAGQYYDFKEVSSSPSFNVANFERKLADQFTKGRIPVIDARNATQTNIDQIKEVVERRGWQKDVVWYP
jgi:hypothetical protein